MKEKGKDSEPKSLEIKFGMIFAHWYKDRCSLHVVIGTGEKNWFSTSAIMLVNENVSLSIAGTAIPEYVDLVLGQWTKEQILEAYDNYFKKPTSQIIVDEINKNAAKPPRTIYF